MTIQDNDIAKAMLTPTINNLWTEDHAARAMREGWRIKQILAEHYDDIFHGGWTLDVADQSLVGEAHQRARESLMLDVVSRAVEGDELCLTALAFIGAKGLQTQIEATD